MENCSKMSEIQTYSINNPTRKSKISSLPQGEGNSSFNLEAHTSTDMKVKRPMVTPNDLTFIVPENKTYSDRDATKRIQTINTDIYEGAKQIQTTNPKKYGDAKLLQIINKDTYKSVNQENEKHEFNYKRYFTIFGIFALLTAAISYFRKGK